MVKNERKEFEGNVLVTISEKEVRLWVCNTNGKNVFRFKVLGKIHKAGTDITIFPIKDDRLDDLDERITHLEKLNYGGLGDI